MKSYYTYYLPPSHAHAVAIRKRKPRPAFDLVKQWLDKYTEYRFDPQICLSFSAPADSALASRAKTLLGKFGPINPSGGIQTLAGKALGSFWDCRFPLERLQEIIELTDHNPEIFRSSIYSHYAVEVTAHFLWLDAARRVLPGQSFQKNEGLSSMLHLFLSQSSHLGVNFCLPFENEHDFLAYITPVSEHLPFVVNHKYWRLCLFNPRTGKKRIARLSTAAKSVSAER